MIKSLSVLFLIIGLTSYAQIDRNDFYKAFQSDSKSLIESQLDQLQKAKQSTRKDAYVGALTMKKSQFMSTPKEKLTVFKNGRILLEKAIEKDKKKGEYRFLRLVIQENVPKILKYRSNMSADVEVIVSRYSSMDSVLKKVVKAYAKESNHLSNDRLK